ncbi:unnamed protein product [Ambrosiozyma monospora]|uniref:Unnamed protein product n=1 Tax=Ambrosiozyma monospora TaxID=43982 RepID=A0ACB5U5T0_AMBMO|nr:unnamed protein product [Ambrosiozyma monospora]
MLSRRSLALIRPSNTILPSLFTTTTRYQSLHTTSRVNFPTSTANIQSNKEYKSAGKVIIDPKTGAKKLVKPMTVNTDKPFPDPLAKQRRTRLGFILFSVVMGVSLFGIFNYEKVSSPVMNATMYFLRRSEVARSKLGKEITFAGFFPWVRGELNTMKGNVDVTVDVSGSLNEAKMHLKANRNTRAHAFAIQQWTLEFADGSELDLLKDASIELTF